ncbi:hypothetical protein VKT23_006330 [Stygiomarasmius scandens]|uniref:Uncharacterized protein n=1 Tax=Marasmiellus scandens TaxID=2682957 RepID=A0ABR1JN44_9AGAR
MEFFKEGSDSVPVIAIFTKCDARNIKANRELRNEGTVNYKDLRRLIPLQVHNYLKGLVDHIKQEAICKPKEFVFLKDMHKGFAATQAQCAELVEKTSQSIDRKALRLLLVSVQQVNMKICIEYAINDFLRYDKKYRLMDKIKEWFPGGGASIKNDIVQRVAKIIIWFPHFYACITLPW